MNAPDPSRIRKHSVRLAGHPTSISIEDAFWERFVEISQIDATRTGNLSSAIRVFVLDHLSRAS